MNWLNIVLALFSNPAIQALIKELESLFQQKAATPQHAAASPAISTKQAVDAIVAKHLK